MSDEPENTEENPNYGVIVTNKETKENLPDPKNGAILKQFENAQSRATANALMAFVPELKELAPLVKKQLIANQEFVAQDEFLLVIRRSDKEPIVIKGKKSRKFLEQMTAGGKMEVYDIDMLIELLFSIRTEKSDPTGEM